MNKKPARKRPRNHSQTKRSFAHRLVDFGSFAHTDYKFVFYDNNGIEVPINFERNGFNGFLKFQELWYESDIPSERYFTILRFVDGEDTWKLNIPYNELSFDFIPSVESIQREFIEKGLNKKIRKQEKKGMWFMKKKKALLSLMDSLKNKR